ncbi:MAG: hypothetical protein HWN67_17655 [Candidatus Helarchaeota archaeon]|nr:hypothetical protein [Candidatus Helarchaeota archaeon]
MVVYLWYSNDEETRRPLGLYTKYFDQYPPEVYTEYSYKETWEPFLKIQKGENLIILVNFRGLTNKIINRIIKSDIEQKILILYEVPWSRRIKKVFKNLTFYTKIFDKIYTYIKPLTNNKNIFYLGNFFAIHPYQFDVFKYYLKNIDNKINRITMVLAEHSRIEALQIKNIFEAFKNPRLFRKLFFQLIDHPNAKYEIAGVQFNKLYGVRSQIVRYFDKFDVIDIFGRSGWNRTKNYKGEAKLIWNVLSRYNWCLCIENNNINNYFSEKPIHAFLSGCIPIMLGGPNPNTVLPKGSFVDLRKFNYKNIPNYIQDERNYHKHSQILKQKYKQVLQHFNAHYKFFNMINTNKDLIYTE